MKMTTTRALKHKQMKWQFPIWGFLSPLPLSWPKLPKWQGGSNPPLVLTLDGGTKWSLEDYAILLPAPLVTGGQLRLCPLSKSPETPHRYIKLHSIILV